MGERGQNTRLAFGGGIRHRHKAQTLRAVTLTATAVLLTVVIRSQAVPYVNHIHEFESPRRHGTVITTAGIRVKTAVRVTGGYRMRMVFLKKRDERCNGIEYKATAQGFTQKPGTDFSNMGTFAPIM